MNEKSRKIIEDVVLNGTPAEKKELYGFDSQTPRRILLKKFKIFTRGNFPRYFKYKSAPFHDDWGLKMIASYYGENHLNIAGRGLAKTTLKKLFDVFVLLNDRDNFRKYIKVLTKDLKNSKQIVTDVYNLIVEVRGIYGDVFDQEGDVKREETMTSFILNGSPRWDGSISLNGEGRKYAAGTVGQTQRGHIQDAYRPDWVWLEDCEDRESISSVAITEGIISKLGEAIDGLSKDGSYFMTANYISDQGVVEWVKNKPSVITTITPLLSNSKDDATANWIIYSAQDVAKIRNDTDDFMGEYCCDPAHSQNKFFDLARIDADLQKAKAPTRESASVKYWVDYTPSHRYAMGNDFSEGVGLDSCTLCLFDFNFGSVVATYAKNDIAPDLATHEFMRVGREFGNCLIIPETNSKCGGTAITTLRAENYPNIYKQKNVKSIHAKETKWGWDTNSSTKYMAFYEFRKDYNDGLITIYDANLLKEMRAYTNADLQESAVGLITRHFDLLMAAIIAWQGRKVAVASSNAKSYSAAYDKYLEN